MSLQQKLDQMVAASKDRIPEAARAVMHRETEALIASGAAGRTPEVGASAPALVAAGPSGPFDLGTAPRPTVLTWFRGNW